MSKNLKRYIVDTNVPIIANRSTAPEPIPAEDLSCVLACLLAIDSIRLNGIVVLDAGDAIFDEYMQHLSLSGQPGPGDAFLKWLYDNRWGFPSEDRVSINKRGDSYDEFPDHPDLADFDYSDKKFVAVAAAHPGHPPILQATDSKWWGWKDALAECGVSITFLCPNHISRVYRKKMVP